MLSGLQRLINQKEALVKKLSQETIVASPQKIKELSQKRAQLEKEIANARKQSPGPYQKDKVLIEIRAGAGGEEAALFAADLLRMYLKYAENTALKAKILDFNKTSLGGYKEVILEITGRDVWQKLSHESGVHRVQRIPKTEKEGRIHTSTVSVAVLPSPKKASFEIKPSDLKIQTFRATGPGGQHVNVTDSAVRITHLPTGIAAACREERSQHQNKAKALEILKAKLFNIHQERIKEKEEELRRQQIKQAERPEKIRTYNFPQNRVTDHRLSKTWKNLSQILEGHLQPIINAFQEKTGGT